MSIPEIILASASPRRRELLAEMGVRFEVVTAEIRELDAETSPGLLSAVLAMENARMKAAAVARVHPGKWVLGADTVVTLQARLFGKPGSLDRARKFLRILSGVEHKVMTGCALISPAGLTHVFHEVTQVTFNVLTEETIEQYLAEVDVLDKAGAYAVQEHGEWIIKRIEGSRTNVIGLPTEHLSRVLQAHGLL